DYVAQPGCAPMGAAEHLDTHDLLGPCVISHVQPGLHLDHRFTTSKLLAVAPLGRHCPSWSRGRACDYTTSSSFSDARMAAMSTARLLTSPRTNSQRLVLRRGRDF